MTAPSPTSSCPDGSLSSVSFSSSCPGSSPAPSPSVPDEPDVFSAPSPMSSCPNGSPSPAPDPSVAGDSSISSTSSSSSPSGEPAGVPSASSFLSSLPVPLLVSACLCGEACRYDGGANAHPVFTRLRESGMVVPVCPEVLGGLPVPREPCERIGERVVSRAGEDVTAAFVAGAEKTLEIALRTGARVAVLKERSPSCGSSAVYDGTFRKSTVPGQGITTELLRRNGITVFSEEYFPE